MHAVIQFLAVVLVCISGLWFAVNMFPKSKDDKFPDGMAVNEARLARESHSTWARMGLQFTVLTKGG